MRHLGDEELKSVLSCLVNTSYPEQNAEMPREKKKTNPISLQKGSENWSSWSEKTKSSLRTNHILQLKNIMMFRCSRQRSVRTDMHSFHYCLHFLSMSLSLRVYIVQNPSTSALINKCSD